MSAGYVAGMRLRRHQGAVDALTMRRAFNDSMQEWPERRAAPPTEKHRFFCECGDEKCTALVVLTGAEYEAVRAHPRRFAVLPTYVRPDVDRVVEEHDSYVVVEKNEAAGRIVEQAAPRRASGA
jgi:hypothetical protein